MDVKDMDMKDMDVLTVEPNPHSRHPAECRFLQSRIRSFVDIWSMCREAVGAGGVAGGDQHAQVL